MFPFEVTLYSVIDSWVCSSVLKNAVEWQSINKWSNFLTHRGAYCLTIQNHQLLLISEDENFSWRGQWYHTIFEPHWLLFWRGQCRRATAGRCFLPIPVVRIKLISWLCSEEKKRQINLAIFAQNDISFHLEAPIRSILVWPWRTE